MKHAVWLPLILLAAALPENGTAQSASPSPSPSSPSPIPSVKKVHEGFQSPVAIVASGGALYISDWSADNVIRIGKDGRRRVLAANVPAAAGLAVDARGRLYVASYAGDYIARLDEDGRIVRIAENLATPTGIAFAKNGELLVANRASGQVLAVNVANGAKRRVSEGFDLPVGVVETADGSIVVSQYGGRVTRVLPDGSRQELGQDFVRPGVGIAADGNYAVLVVDNGAGVIRRVDFNGKTDAVTSRLGGNVVALGKGIDGEWLIGAWDGGIYQLAR